MEARVVGGSEVRLIDISRRGVLVETQTRLQFGAKATIRFTTSDASATMRAHVVRSRVAGIGESLVYHTALAFEEELHLADTLAHPHHAAVAPPDLADSFGSLDPLDEPDLSMMDTYSPFALDGSVSDDNGELLLNDGLNFLVALDGDLADLQLRAEAHGDD